MFDHLFPLLGSSGIGLPLLSVLGVVLTIVLTEALGVALGRARSRPRKRLSTRSPAPPGVPTRGLPLGHLSA